MEFLKTWARSIYILSVLSSLTIVLSPKRMQKEVRFVLEMLVLLLVVSPLIGFIGRSIDSETIRQDPGHSSLPGTIPSLESFFQEETKRRVFNIAKSSGFPLESVSLEVKGVFPELTVARAEVVLAETKSDEEKLNLKKLLSTYLNIPEQAISIRAR